MRRAVVTVCTTATLSLSGAAALAHGMSISARGDGGDVVGTVQYSDGRPAAGEFVELLRAPAADKPGERAVLAGAQTDALGGFRLAGEAGGQHVIVAYGEEGHTTELAIRLLPDASATPAAVATPMHDHGDIPAWRIAAALLLALLGPVVWFVTRRNA